MYTIREFTVAKGGQSASTSLAGFDFWFEIVSVLEFFERDSSLTLGGCNFFVGIEERSSEDGRCGGVFSLFKVQVGPNYVLVTVLWV